MFHVHAWGQKIGVNEEHVVFSMVYGVEDLLGRKPNVHRMEDSAYHGDRVEAFQVPVAVPVQHAYGVAGLYTQVFQEVCQLPDSLMKRHIAVAFFILVDNFLPGSA